MTFHLTDGRITRLVVFSANDPARIVGGLQFEKFGDRRVGRFLYHEDWLRTGLPIDPVQMPLGNKKSVSGAPHQAPFAFFDYTVDGWGKTLLDYAYPEVRFGLAEHLAVAGSNRTGDLLFGPDASGPATWSPAPLDPSDRQDPSASLEELETFAAAAFEMDAGNQIDPAVLRRLIRSSLDVGGARPKIRFSTRFDEGLEVGWIAKFQAPGDPIDEPKLEAVCLELAKKAGITSPNNHWRVLSGRSILMSRRFDRSPTKKYSYLSAATILQQDPTSYTTSFTYVDLARAAERIGVPRANAAIYERLIFNRLIHNTDDHLRNTAFIRKDRDWLLSPIFDVLPHPTPGYVCAPARGMQKNAGLVESAGAFEQFGLKAHEAEEIYSRILDASLQITAIMDRLEVTAEDRAKVQSWGFADQQPSWSAVRGVAVSPPVALPVPESESPGI